MHCPECGAAVNAPTVNATAIGATNLLAGQLAAHWRARHDDRVPLTFHEAREVARLVVSTETLNPEPLNTEHSK